MSCTLVDPDSPLMMAWETYKSDPGYENVKKWAKLDQHADGSFWDAFYAGWEAAKTEAEAVKSLNGILEILEES
jgi:hypothetical protein